MQRWAARDSPLFALGQALRESLERFDQAVAQADPAAKAPCWPRWMWRMSRQERRERLERLHAERKQRKEAKRLRRLEEQEQAAAAQRERDEAQRRKRERMNRVFIRADPAASTSQERPAAGLSELVEDDRQEETKSAAAYEGKTEKLDKGKEKAVDSDNEEEIDDFEAPLDLEQQQGREEEAPNYDKATLTLMDTTQQATVSVNLSLFTHTAMGQFVCKQQLSGEDIACAGRESRGRFPSRDADSHTGRVRSDLAQGAQQLYY